MAMRFRAGPGRGRSSSPRATPATPRRPWPRTTTRSSAARRGWSRRRAARSPRARAAPGGRGRAAVRVTPLPGGFQPRAAIGYALVSALEAAALAGAAPSVRDEIEAAAELAAQLAVEWGPHAPEDSEAKSIARALHDTVPVIAGAELA